MNRKTNLAMIGILATPCAADVILWCVLMINPKFGFSDNLTSLFATIYLGSWLSLIFGICVVLDAKKFETTSATNSVFLGFFIAVGLLNVCGFFWSVGMVGNAFR